MDACIKHKFVNLGVEKVDNDWENALQKQHIVTEKPMIICESCGLEWKRKPEEKTE